MELNYKIFGFNFHGEGIGYIILGIFIFIGMIIILPLILIWTANQMFNMDWDYTIQYWFGALILLIILWALCPTLNKVK